MFSSVNPFGGLSAANILTLFSTLSTSSRASSDQLPRSSSSNMPTGSAEAIKEIVQGGAPDPAKTIKTILAQAQVEQAQNATSDEGEPTEAEIAKEAHDDKYGTDVQTFSFVEETQNNSSDAPGGTPSPSSVSLSGANAVFSAVHAVSQAHNAGYADSAALAVVTPDQVASLGDGNLTNAGMVYREATPLDAYQLQSGQVQVEEAYFSSANATPNSTASAGADAPSAASANLQGGQSYLRLAIMATNLPSDPTAINQTIDAQAQQLVSAFERGTLSSTTSEGSGFSYTENLGADTAVSIVGIEVSSSDQLIESNTLTASGSQSLSPYQDLANESTELAGGYTASGQSPLEELTFMIPFASS